MVNLLSGLTVDTVNKVLQGFFFPAEVNYHLLSQAHLVVDYCHFTTPHHQVREALYSMQTNHCSQ